MPRLPLGELEEARRDPSAYREKLDRAAEKKRGVTYTGSLRHAIQRFHRTGDAHLALRYLEERLTHPRLKSPSRKAETFDQLTWYIDEVTGRGWPTFEVLFRIEVPLLGDHHPDLVCSGELLRVDVVPSGGYAGWLSSSKLVPDWRQELRMPLIQSALARSVLGVPLGEVSIGVYGFDQQSVESHRYTDADVAEAQVSLGHLITRLGF